MKNPWTGEDRDRGLNAVDATLESVLERATEGRLATLEVIKAADVARLTQEAWDEERQKMLKTCRQCHSGKFANGEMEKGDKMIREADILLAEAIRLVAALYADEILTKPENYAHPFPDLLTFHDAPTPIEQRLFMMFMKHRMRTFQGTFHANPDYAFWYGWAEMQRDLADIKEKDREMRRRDSRSILNKNQYRIQLT